MQKCVVADLRRTCGGGLAGRGGRLACRRGGRLRGLLGGGGALLGGCGGALGGAARVGRGGLGAGHQCLAATHGRRGLTLQLLGRLLATDPRDNTAAADEQLVVTRADLARDVRGESHGNGLRLGRQGLGLGLQGREGGLDVLALDAQRREGARCLRAGP